MKLRLQVRVGVLALLSVVEVAQPQVQFIEVGDERGVQPLVMEVGLGGGVAAADVDDDGDVDLFVPNARGKADQFYLNLGDGTFQEVAQNVGLGSSDSSRVALWFDYDGDHRLDLFTASDCYKASASPVDCIARSTFTLYRQTESLTFVDVTTQAGLTDDRVTTVEQHRGGVCAGDVNQDGFLDLLVGLWGGPVGSNTFGLFLNHGDGSFVDVSQSSGVAEQAPFAWQPMMHDWNGDGWLDIYSAVDFNPNVLWVNQHNGSFIDLAPSAGLDNVWQDMGQTLGDYDNDGDLDIYITNIEENRDGEARGNLLLRNDSEGPVLQFNGLSDVGVEEGGWGWGATFFDADNDGDLDIASTNGSNIFYLYDSSKFFLNEGGEPVGFVDRSDAVGFNDTFWGSSLVALDFDRDGDLDLVQTINGSNPEQPHGLRLLENHRGPAALTHHYLVVKPRMSGANHRGIGAVVRVEAGGLRLMRLISAGTSFLGQEPAEAFFGLGAMDHIDRVSVEWPDGTVDVVTAVSADQVLTIFHTGRLFADGFEGGNTSSWNGEVVKVRRRLDK